MFVSGFSRKLYNINFLFFYSIPLKIMKLFLKEINH